MNQEASFQEEVLFRTHDIGKTFGVNTVLQGINMEIRRGEIKIGRAHV